MKMGVLRMWLVKMALGTNLASSLRSQNGDSVKRLLVHACGRSLPAEGLSQGGAWFLPWADLQGQSRPVHALPCPTNTL